MTGFQKVACERAYATGALVTTLNEREFAAKLKRFGLSVKPDGGFLHIHCDGAVYSFGDWQHDGLERTGWLVFTTDDVFTLTQKLAQAGIRHRFEWSRPFDLVTDDVRCVTSFDYGWSDPRQLGLKRAEVQTYDEPITAASAVRQHGSA